MDLPADENFVDPERGVAADQTLVRALLAQSTSGAFVMDADGRCDLVNERWCELTGLSSTTGTGDGWMAGVHPDERAEVVSAWWSSVQDGRPFEQTFRVLRPDGTVRHVRSTAHRVMDHTGAPIAWIGSLEPAVAPVAASGADEPPGLLRAAIGRFEQAFERSPIGMAITTLDGAYVRVNQALCDLLDRSAESLLSTTVLDTTHPEDLRRTVDSAIELLEGLSPSFSLEKRFLAGGGRPVWTRSTTTLLRDDDERPLHFLTQVEDIEERRILIEELRQSALRDPLTGLANRSGLEEFVAEVPAGTEIGVIALDLDRFKSVNDRSGHGAGDEVLRVVARRIQQSVRSVDHAARTGGDEFVVICAGPPSEPAVAEVARRLVERISAPINVGGEELSVSASAGVAVGPAEDAAALRIAADEASYRAKRDGGAVVSLSGGG